jgi:hypothetical protein
LSARPGRGSLLSVTVGITTSIQIGFALRGLKKLHSFLVAADAACSKGDLPVVAVDATLAAVAGFATAAVPAVLAAAEPVLVKAASGAAHPMIRLVEQSKPTLRMSKHQDINYLLRQATLKTPAAHDPFGILS